MSATHHRIAPQHRGQVHVPRIEAVIHDDQQATTIGDLVERYVNHMMTRTHRGAEGRPTPHAIAVRAQLKYVTDTIGHLRPEAVNVATGGAMLQAIGDTGVLSRRYVNEICARFRTCARWGASRGMVPASLVTELSLLVPLRTGETVAHESPGRKAVDLRLVRRTTRHMHRETRGLVLLQCCTGARMGELVIMRMTDIDTTGAVWIYRPYTHKNAHRGHERQIPLGPRAQRVLRYFIRFAEGPEDYLFSPKRCAEWVRQQRHAKRVTPLRYGNTRGTARKPGAKDNCGDHYTTTSVAQAIRKACRRTFTPPPHLAPQASINGQLESRNAQRRRLEKIGLLEELIAWEHANFWTSHQIRHAVAVRLRIAGGIDLAQAVLGHRTRAMTEHYSGHSVNCRLADMATLG